MNECTAQCSERNPAEDHRRHVRVGGGGIDADGCEVERLVAGGVEVERLRGESPQHGGAGDPAHQPDAGEHQHGHDRRPRPRVHDSSVTGPPGPAVEDGRFSGVPYPGMSHSCAGSSALSSSGHSRRRHTSPGVVEPGQP